MKFKTFKKLNILDGQDLIKCIQKPESVIKEERNKTVLKKREYFIKHIWSNVKNASSIGMYIWGTRFAGLERLSDFYDKFNLYNESDGKIWFEDLKKEMLNMGYKLIVYKSDVKMLGVYGIWVEVRWDKYYDEEDLELPEVGNVHLMYI